ncbi:uncharacterized protein [Rutidosis leptorrhynchoides]|uniref:uncharacterized protein n=1 Tax=Rutidosis leptorrhynchoides TaxID=125765 RepID=UPI003A9938AE
MWSDHCPILLCKDVVDYGPIPFKLFHSWFNMEDFDKTVLEAWNDPVLRHSTNSMTNFKDRLKHVKAALKLWNKDTRARTEHNKRSLTERLNDINLQLKSRVDPSTLATSRASIIKDLASIESLETANLAQKNKRLIYGLGYENSGFFHTSLNRKRKKLQISGVMSNGIWVTQPTQVKDMFFQFFKNKFSPMGQVPICTPSRNLKRLSSSSADSLTVPFSESDIKDVIWSCGSDKAPGPDGFSFKFVKYFWEYIKGDIIDFVSEFHTNFVIPRGSPSLEFDIGRGLRQGDPLSPLLFIIGMEGLHAAIQDAVDASLYFALNVGNNNSNVSISHYLFADDVIFIGEWKESNAQNLLTILGCFFAVSGLRININKSSLYGVGVPQHEVSRLALALGCEASSFPFRFLGLPVGLNMNRVNNWLNLIKYVLGALGTYYFSLFKAPKQAINTLESIRADFLWGRNNHERKIHSVISPSRMYMRIGIGNETNFWFDTWVGGCPLASRFPRLLALDCNHSTSVASRYPVNGWIWYWRRNIRGGVEQDQFDQLVSILKDISFSHDPDLWIWDGPSTSFTVSHAR